MNINFTISNPTKFNVTVKQFNAIATQAGKQVASFTVLGFSLPKNGSSKFTVEINSVDFKDILLNLTDNILLSASIPLLISGISPYTYKFSYTVNIYDLIKKI